MVCSIQSIFQEAEANYLEFGACEEEMLRYVRPPESDENGHS